MRVGARERERARDREEGERERRGTEEIRAETSPDGGRVRNSHPEQQNAPELVKRFVRYGSSPRGAQALILYARILAILDERYHVACDDIDQAAVPVLRHRLMLNFEGQAENVSVDHILTDLIRSTESAGEQAAAAASAV